MKKIISILMCSIVMCIAAIFFANIFISDVDVYRVEMLQYHENALWRKKYAGYGGWDMETLTGQVEPEQLFRDYIQNTLVPWYGVMSTQELYTQDVNSSGGTNAWSNQDLTGLLSASIKDFDQDGQEELLVIRCETVTENPYPSVEDAVTYSYMQMYEYDPEMGEVVQAAEKKLQMCNKLIDALGFGQIGFFTYSYGGKQYIAVDNFDDANENIVTLDLYSYDGTQFSFVKGLGYQEQGEGDICVWEAAAEPQGKCLTNCANWVEPSEENGNTWQELMSFWVADYDYQKQLTREEMQQFYSLYSSKLQEIGLQVVDMRLGINQGEPEADANGLDYKSWYNQYAELTAVDTYTALEGEIEFLSGVSTHQILGGPLCLFRRDYGGSLDAYRSQDTAVSAEAEAAMSAEPEESTGQILPDSNSRYLTDADLTNLSLQQICYAKNEIYARHGRKFLSDELTDYFNSQPWYTGSIEAADFTEEMVDAVFNEYEKANMRFLADWEEKYGAYNPQ